MIACYMYICIQSFLVSSSKYNSAIVCAAASGGSSGASQRGAEEYMCIYEYIYIYIYMYMWICIQLYIYIQREREKERDNILSRSQWRKLWSFLAGRHIHEYTKINKYTMYNHMLYNTKYNHMKSNSAIICPAACAGSSAASQRGARGLLLFGISFQLCCCSVRVALVTMFVDCCVLCCICCCGAPERVEFVSFQRGNKRIAVVAAGCLFPATKQYYQYY